MSVRAVVMLGLVLSASTVDWPVSAHLQRTVRAMDGWIKPGGPTEATAFVVVDNGTMYDIYLVGAESDAAGSVELVQTTNGKTARVKEVPVAAFDRLEMSADGTFLKLSHLKRAFKSGETATILLVTDAGERLSVAAVVK
jgi:copper(I)-binding protein